MLDLDFSGHIAFLQSYTIIREAGRDARVRNVDPVRFDKFAWLLKKHKITLEPQVLQSIKRYRETGRGLVGWKYRVIGAKILYTAEDMDAPGFDTALKAYEYKLFSTRRRARAKLNAKRKKAREEKIDGLVKNNLVKSRTITQYEYRRALRLAKRSIAKIDREKRKR